MRLELPAALHRTYVLLHRPAKFAMVGVANTGLDFALFWLLITFGGLQPVVANTCSYSTAIVNSYVLNRVWTFRGAPRTMRTMAQFGRFVCLNLIGLGISNLVVWAMSSVLVPVAAKLLAVLATFTWNYWSTRRFVYLAAPASPIGK